MFLSMISHSFALISSSCWLLLHYVVVVAIVAVVAVGVAVHVVDVIDDPFQQLVDVDFHLL